MGYARKAESRPHCLFVAHQSFVDPEAGFFFITPADVPDFAAREGATPFDVPDVELGHHGPRCSFDAIISKYRLTDPALLRLATIVRGADTDAKDLTPESRGVDAIAEGFGLVFKDDHEQLAREWSVYDALNACCRGKTAG